MTTQTPPWRRGNGLPPTWMAALVEPAPIPGEHNNSAIPRSHYRLSRAGQILLGLAITVLAGLLYWQTVERNQQLSQQFALCLPVQPAGRAQAEAVRQTQSLINNLTHATPAQKLRLSQQYKLLLSQSVRLCGVASLYRSQESALMTVATSALCLLSLTIALGLTHGLVNNSNRTLNALQVTAAFLLVVPMLFLQLGEQVRNTPIFFQLYLTHRNLIQQLQSALANQDLPVFQVNPGDAQAMDQKILPGLSDPGKVALLIRRLDHQLQALPAVPLNFNDSTVIHVYGWLSSSWQQAISK